ncbi:MAG: pantoate--beta-alanine ligase [Bdellovibrionales bacterium RIFCSPHIGHO2_01_FULL_40_29]|nr:MAG: pantoate--beta-alanine ligase [Bdellovibrionales bacterium RIFCSPHIGHO2_01_FULL_40_29]OFZ35099.1 MAG: pantoate--beta-alanine ligase [Bdellovibrionales bacterium RIFCSPHIGHO2_02_FULL_40_15]
MSKVQVFDSMTEFLSFRQTFSPDVEIGFVPTMGALHQGHVSLLNRSIDENDFTVLSIFVNPTQFNDPTDFTKYPKTWDADMVLATAAGVNAIIAPTYNQLYPDNYRYKIIEGEFSKKLCGAERIGHFDGVLTVVMKLLQIVRPHKAYFGEKDYQQFKLIHDMVQSFFMPIQVVPCPTLREASGLAMSSRNTRLSAEGLKKAALIYQFISEEKTTVQAAQKLTDHGFQVEYLQDEGDRRFVAAFLEGVRLIDNVTIK